MKGNIVRTSALVTVILFIGYVIAFLRESIIAYFFGISADVDAYTIAIAIPVNLFSIVTISVQSIIIPIYSRLLYQTSYSNSERANYLNSLISIVIILSVLLVCLFELFSGPIAYLFAPGLTEETHLFVVKQLRLVLPTIIFSLLCYVYTGVLNVHKSFAIPALTVWLLNLGVIFAIIILHEKLGILSACIGQIFGCVLQYIVLFFYSRRHIHFKFTLDFKSPFILETGGKIIPIIWSTGVAEINTIVNRAVASLLFVGAVSALNYSSKINAVLITFFTSAIATVVYPLYAESGAKNDITQLSNRLNLTLSAYTFFLLPLMSGVLCLKKELVSVAFGRGAFDASAINITQRLLGLYAIGIIFIAFRETLTKVYYSLDDTSTPAKNATFGLILNIILSILLPYLIGVDGLPLASSISALFIAMLLVFHLLKKFNTINLSFFLDNIKKLLIPLSLMTFSVMLLRQYISLPDYLVLAIETLLGAFIYLLSSYFLKVPIAKQIFSKFIKGV